VSETARLADSDWRQSIELALASGRDPVPGHMLLAVGDRGGRLGLDSELGVVLGVGSGFRIPNRRDEDAPY